MKPALQRGLTILCQRVVLPEMPAWLTELDFGQAFAVANPWEVGTLVQSLRAAERQLRLRSAGRAASNGAKWELVDPSVDVPALPAWAADDQEAQKRMVVALGRLALGAAIEAAIAEETLDRVAPGGRTTDGDHVTGRLYQDSFLVALWSSAHAQYISYIQSGVEEPPLPGISTVPNSAAEFDLSDLYSRRFCQRLCPKGATSLLQVLCRSTNPGSRGWNTLLDSALQESMATRTIVTNAVVVALSAMHPYLHPVLRPPWYMRMRISRVAQHKLMDSEARSMLVQTAAATKEAVRRMLASTMCAAPAMQAGFAHISHPVGLLVSPPLSMPARGMEGAMAAFVHAGVALATSLNAVVSYSLVVNKAFRTPSDADDEEAGEGDRAMEWDAPWLGKGTSSTHQKVPLVTVASDLWAVAFRSNFIVFWAHCMSKALRASRLDAVQHRAIHGLNAATKLTMQLSEEQQLQVQRLALGHASAGLLTMEEAAGVLDIDGVKGTSSNGGAKGAQDALRAMSAGGAGATARLLVFARAAWISEELLIVDLGKETKQKQLRALYKRLGRTDYRAGSSTTDDLPVHATHLHACVECHRVANAYAVDGGKQGVTFNELGVSSSMLCTVCTGEASGTTHIRCAKRSSAALRTALTFEESMVTREVESEVADPVAVSNLLGCASTLAKNESDPDSGIAARVRRDAKNALEQQAAALACGERPMLCTPVVGRAIRLWNEWYALCSLCGGMLRVLPQHRYGAEICCLKCDAQMLGLPAPSPPAHRATTCRYCSAADPERRASQWKSIKAPLDMSGANAMLPPPMRSVFYCPKHWRSWLVSAHRVLPTRVILSHIAHNAKPIHSTGAGASRTAAELGFDAPTNGRKRRRAKGPREEGTDAE